MTVALDSDNTKSEDKSWEEKSQLSFTSREDEEEEADAERT